MKIKVLVKTGQPAENISYEDDEYKICLKSKPVSGRANQELIKLLRKYFKKEARIIAGKSGRKKLVEII